MSAHYNRVMMKQLREPLIALLNQLSILADQVARGEVAPEQLSGWEQATDLSNTFKIVNCLAMAKLSQTLAEALEGISKAPSRGWSDAQAAQVAQAAKDLAEAFIPLIENLAKGADVLPITLWPQWTRLLTLMNAPTPDAVALFEPGADFADVAFTQLDPAFLKNSVQGATVRLDAAMAKLRTAEQSEHANDFAHALAEVQEVFDWAYRTPHRRGFMPYWLIVRARLVDARLHAGATLAAPDAIHRLVRNANLELQRFGANARQVPQERLMEDISPLLEPWDDATQANDIMRELRDRFGLDAFWTAVEQNREKKGHPAGQATEQVRAELSALLERVCDAWARWYATTGDMKDVIRAFAALVMRMDSFSPEARNLIKVIQVAMEWTAKRPNDERDADVSSEISSGLVTLEDLLAATPAQLPGLSDRVNQQIRRLRAVMVPGRLEYQQLPIIRWGAQRMRQETQLARQKALGRMIETLNKIEETIDNVMREEADVRDVKKLLTDIQVDLDVAGHALDLLRMPQHAKLIHALRLRLKQLVDRPTLLKEPKERQSLTVALPAILTSLTHHVEGYGLDDDHELLTKASEGLLNEAPVGAQQASEWASASPVLGVADVKPVPAVAETPPVEPEPVIGAPTPVEASEDPLLSVQPTEETEEAALVAADELEYPKGISPGNKDVLRALLSEAGYTDTLDGADPDILEGFFMEAPGHVDDVHGWRHTLRDHPTDETAWEDLRRAFHTVKGSGRFVRLVGLTEVAWWMERFVDIHWKAKAAYSDAIDRVVAQGQAWLEQNLNILQRDRQATLHAAPLWATLVAFQNGETPAEAEAPPAHEALVEAPVVAEEAPVVAPAGPALAQWAQDAEARTAVHQDLRKRRLELTEVSDTQDPDLLLRVAHTLRTLSMMVGLPRWEKECAEVERHLSKGEGLDEQGMMELVDRWLPVIDDLLLDDPNPEASLETPWQWPEGVHSPAPLADTVTRPAVADEAEPLPDHESEGAEDQPADADTDFDLHVVAPVFHEPPHEPAPVEVVEEVSHPVTHEPPVDEPVEANLPRAATFDPTPEPVAQAPQVLAPAHESDGEEGESDREALWNEVLQAHSLMMEGGRRLGEALMKLMAAEAEEDEES